MSYLRDKLPELSPPQVVTEPWRKALLDAAEYIRVHGLCKDGQFKNMRGEVCAWGALSQVTFGRPHDLGLALQKLTLRVGRVPFWNDAPERTKEEVVAELEAAARS